MPAKPPDRSTVTFTGSAPGPVTVVAPDGRGGHLAASPSDLDAYGSPGFAHGLRLRAPRPGELTGGRPPDARRRAERRVAPQHRAEQRLVPDGAGALPGVPADLHRGQL